MTFSDTQLLQLVHEIAGPAGPKQFRASQMLAAFISNPHIKAADLVTAWKVLQQHPSHPHPIALYKPFVAAIAVNPITPTDTLLEVAYHAPKSFCVNPALPELLAAQPELLRSRVGRRRGTATLLRLLRYEKTPRFITEPISHWEDSKGDTFEQTEDAANLAEDARNHISLTGEASETQWRTEVTDFWHAYVRTRDRKEREEHQELAIAGLLPDWAFGETEEDRKKLQEARQRYQRALNYHISPEECRELARHDDSFAVRLAAIINPASPETERIRITKEGIGPFLVFRSTFSLLPILRRHSILQTTDAIAYACHDVLLHLSNVDDFYHDLHRYRLQGFLVSTRYPSHLENPVKSQMEGKRWTELLAWTQAVQPDAAGKWNQQHKAGLEALSHDGNRWVRAAAKARLSAPSAVLDW
jgi:hypothetical protein